MRSEAKPSNTEQCWCEMDAGHGTKDDFRVQCDTLTYLLTTWPKSQMQSLFHDPSPIQWSSGDLFIQLLEKANCKTVFYFPKPKQQKPPAISFFFSLKAISFLFFSFFSGGGMYFSGTKPRTVMCTLNNAVPQSYKPVCKYLFKASLRITL